MKENKYEIIMEVTTSWSKEKIRKELVALFSENSIIKASTITIKKE